MELSNQSAHSRFAALSSANIRRAPGGGLSLARLALVAPLLVAAPLLAQGDQRVIIDSAAASAFVHQGKPIHPFCVWFPQERSSRGRANELAECSDTSIVPELRDGWTTARFPERRGYSSYRVLAREGDRFLLALESSGGGSGEFSDLAWVQVGATTIRDVKDILGGDRCAGALSGYHVDARTVGFSAAVSTADVVRLAGASIADSVVATLSSGYHACTGQANYTYDLTTDSLTLTSVTLAADRSTAVRADTAALRRDPQACFEEQTRHLAGARTVTLGLPELRTFVARLAEECIH